MGVAVVRNRDWRAALAIAAVTVLPVLRNQQYAYVKFFVLWPVLVGVLAVRFCARHVLAAALLVFAMNGWVLASEVTRGRHLYAGTEAAYRGASRTTCWMTSGWGPPFHYLWPGATSGILATLATGIDPATQARALTASLLDCFCGASEVWTDTGSDSAPVVRLLATHFHYDAVDLTKLLFDPSKGSRVGTTSPPIYAYSDRARSDTCRSLTPPTGQQTGAPRKGQPRPEAWPRCCSTTEERRAQSHRMFSVISVPLW